MTSTASTKSEDEAIAWFVALQGGDATEAQFRDFTVWLEVSPVNREAYARVEAAWVAAEPPADAAIAPLRKPSRAPAIAWWGAGIAAAAAALFVLPQLSVHTNLYRTSKGERRDVVLADGSHLVLNSDSAAKVSLGRHERRVELTGEALFQVVHDPARPFEVAAGDAKIRDIGTVFDVRRRDNGLTVTVLEGRVAVGRPATAALELGVGEELRVKDGGSAEKLKVDDPEAAAAWKSGRLVYRNQTLGEVASDLNRYLPSPISVDAKASALRFSGVLQLDREDVVVRRLEALLPVKATTTSSGVQLSAAE